MATPPDPALGLTWRPVTPADVPAWSRLVQAAAVVDRPTERYDAADLLEELTAGSWKDPEHDALGGWDPDGGMAAVGLVEELPGATCRRVRLWGDVHPAHRGRGVGRELLRWQRERAHEKLAAVSPHARGEVDDRWRDEASWRVQVWLLPRQADRARLARAAGLPPVRWFHDLHRPLGPGAVPVPDVAVPAGLRVVGYEPRDAERVRLAHNDAFAGHWGSQPCEPEPWRVQVVEQRAFRPGWTFLAVDPARTDGHGRPEVAGYVTGAAYEQDWQAQGYRQGWTGLLGVRPAWRGRRLAPALLATQLRAFEADGMQAAGLDVDTGNATGAPALYEAMGYRVEETSVLHAEQG